MYFGADIHLNMDNKIRKNIKKMIMADRKNIVSVDYDDKKDTYIVKAVNLDMTFTSKLGGKFKKANITFIPGRKIILV